MKVKNESEEGGGLERFGAHRKAIELFDFVVQDLSKLSTDFTLTRLIGQQYASADSIAANIEEGYGRGSRKEYTQFLIIARGSAQETMGRYQRFKHWLPEGTINLRTLLCREIIAILTATIKKLRTLDPK
ncbi:MAG: four helix bundle protein [Verrucomicrobia bacterium]|nr:four helix bundle protein [Verrucomicrobiota bacterium]